MLELKHVSAIKPSPNFTGLGPAPFAFSFPVLLPRRHRCSQHEQLFARNTNRADLVRLVADRSKSLRTGIEERLYATIPEGCKSLCAKGREGGA